MSVEYLTEALETNLPAAQKLLLFIMADNVVDEAGHCFMNNAHFAKRCSLSELEVEDYIQRLKQAGYITDGVAPDDRPCYQLFPKHKEAKR